MGDCPAAGAGAFGGWRGLLLLLECTMQAGWLRAVQIETSVIGRECEIGRGCVVRDSYIGDGVTLHEGAMVVGALLLAGAVIHAGAKLLPGCIVSHKVLLPVQLQAGASGQKAPARRQQAAADAQMQAAFHIAVCTPACQRWVCQTWQPLPKRADADQCAPRSASLARGTRCWSESAFRCASSTSRLPASRTTRWRCPPTPVRWHLCTRLYHIIEHGQRISQLLHQPLLSACNGLGRCWAK